MPENCDALGLSNEFLIERFHTCLDNEFTRRIVVRLRSLFLFRMTDFSKIIGHSAVTSLGFALNAADWSVVGGVKCRFESEA